ncbi:kinesin-like protein Klp5 [Dinochytrium kinnereticum]|nr:kinesin-like protein Klp5 [Dinochytrium kinnereticum]
MVDSAASNITVVVRVRPLLPFDRVESIAEKNESDPKKSFRRIVAVLDERVLVFDPLDQEQVSTQRMYRHGARRNKEVRYAFDKVFGEQSSQQQIFEGTTKPLIDDVLNGYNTTLFAYGATGCGKTHTITGTEEDPGIIFRTMRELFSRIESNSDERITDVSLSYLEVYNETIRDLLGGETTNTSVALDVREDDARVIVAGLSEHRPKDVDDVMQMLIKGNENRTRAPTEANAVSSRSHAILQIHVKQKQRTSAIVQKFSLATFSIIDLAGSERASVTKNKGERLLEGANINRSLLALGNCINALCGDKPNHIPYRDSKLTRLLKFSLSGNCKVVMIANISPAIIHYEETHNTLKYANRAKNIKTKVYRNSLSIDNHISQYPRIIDELRSEIGQLKEKLATQEPEPTDYVSPEASSEVFNDVLRRIRKHYEKIQEKGREQVHADLNVQQNERKLAFLKALLSSMPESDISETLRSTEIWQFYLDYKAGVLDAMDHLHELNVALRHNSGEASLAIERHRMGIERLIATGPTARRLTPQIRERLHLESTMLQLSTENDRLCSVVKHQDDHFDANSLVTGEIAKFYGRNIVAVYENISSAAKRSDPNEIQRQTELLQISAQVLALVVGKASEGTQPTALSGMTEGAEDPESVDIVYDTASESESEMGDVDVRESDSVAGDEDMEGAWKVALNSFSKESGPNNEENVFMAQITGSVSASDENAVTSTVKRRRLDRKLFEEEDEMEQEFNTPTKSRLRTRKTSVDPERTPVAKPRTRSIQSIKAKPLAVNLLLENQDAKVDTEKSEKESPKKMKRRHARQSLIPKMRSTPLRAELSVPSRVPQTVGALRFANTETSTFTSQPSANRLKRPLDSLAPSPLLLPTIAEKTRPRRSTRAATAEVRAAAGAGGDESGWETLTDGGVSDAGSQGGSVASGVEPVMGTRSWANVGVGSLMLLANAVISSWFGLGLEATLAVSSIRCVVQLSILGLVLKPGNYFAIQAAPWYRARDYVTILGMLLGNSMSGVAVGLSSTLTQISEHKERIEFYLAHGASRWEAAKPIGVEAIRLALLPTLNAMSVMGLISIPGMMTGQILGGASIDDAVRYQQIVMFMITSCCGLATVSTVVICLYICFDDCARLRLDRIHAVSKTNWRDYSRSIVEWFRRPNRSHETEPLLNGT